MFKKFLLAILLFSVTLTPALAQEEALTTSEEITNESFEKPLYFARAGCPHCARVDAFIQKYNLSSQVTKIETLNNPENIQELDKWFNHFNIPQNSRGVPFFVINEERYLSGSANIINYLADENDIEIEEEDYKSSASDTIFLVLGGLLLFGVLGYGIYSAVSKKK